MRKVLLTTCFIFFMLGSPLFAENLFIMGWDGAGLFNVQRLLKEGKLPNLQGLIDTGGCLIPLELLGKTCTIPSWTHVFTGLTYDQTGVLGNRRYRSNTIDTSMDASYIYPGLDFWMEVIPYEHTIIQAIQAKDYRIGWFTSKDYLGISPLRSPLANIAQNADDYLTILPDEEENYMQTLSQRTVNFIKENNPFFIFLLVNPDYYGHLDGENSERYEQEFIRSDYWLGVILQLIDRSNTKWIVISDHGFDENKTTHRNAPDAWMATDLPIKSIYCSGETVGTIRDVANTILDFYGIDSKTRLPKMRGKSLLRH